MPKGGWIMELKEECLWNCVGNTCLSFDSVFVRTNCKYLKVICPTCGAKCYADTYKTFGCPHCQKREYEEMKNQQMNIQHNGLD